MRCLANALIIFACLANFGCGGSPKVEAEVRTGAAGEPLFSMPQLLSLFLESADTRSPWREYKSSHQQETVGVLLTVASANVDDVKKAATLFLERATSADDRMGREDLLNMLVNLMVDDPNRQVHIAWEILYIQDGKLVTKDKWPTTRFGSWQRDFHKTLDDGLHRHGRRDLTTLIANHVN